MSVGSVWGRSFVFGGNDGTRCHPLGFTFFFFFWGGAGGEGTGGCCAISQKERRGAPRSSVQLLEAWDTGLGFS